MGLTLWLVAGLAAAATARLLRPGRSDRWLAEGLAANAAALIFGIIATSLDFGGWREPDWRAGLFAFAGAAAAVASLRIALLLRS